MEIKKLETRTESNKGREMQVRGWDGKLTDFYITLAGIDSDKWQKVKREIQQKIFLGEDPDAPTSLADVTISWRGLVDNGKEVPFSHEAAASLYREAPYIREQADRFVADRENFTRPLKKG